MNIEITRPREACYPDPITFETGAALRVVRGDPDFPGWFWCQPASGPEGWVHQSFLAAAAGETVSVKPYSARELTVAAGDRGTVLEELDGWLYIRLDAAAGEVGWIPQTHARRISSEPLSVRPSSRL